jgi:hypothetical protein
LESRATPRVSTLTEHDEEGLEAGSDLTAVLEVAKGKDASRSGKLPLDDGEDDDESAEGHESSDDDAVRPSAVDEVQE